MKPGSKNFASGSPELWYEEFSLPVARACDMPTIGGSVYPTPKSRVEIHIVTSKSRTLASY